MDFLTWYENSLIGDAVRETTWVYPWVNAFHSVGMGFLVGVLSMIILRVLGFGRFSLAPLRKFVLVVRLGIAVNVATGLVLFAGDAQRFFHSPTFRVKAMFLVLGGITTWMLVERVFGKHADWLEAGDAPQAAKMIAAASLLCWFGAIFAGRMTAYLP
jgi:hypothetical protein